MCPSESAAPSEALPIRIPTRCHRTQNGAALELLDLLVEAPTAALFHPKRQATQRTAKQASKTPNPNVQNCRSHRSLARRVAAIDVSIARYCGPREAPARPNSEHLESPTD